MIKWSLEQKVNIRGIFVAGQRNGEGIYKHLKTKDLFSGSWENGLKNGKCTFIFFDTKMKIVGDRFNGQIMKRKCQTQW